MFLKVIKGVFHLNTWNLSVSNVFLKLLHQTFIVSHLHWASACVKSVFKKQNIYATCLQYEEKTNPTLLLVIPEVVSLFSKAWAQGCAATAVTLLGMAGWGEAGAYWYLQATGKGDCVFLSIHRPAQVDFVLITSLRVGTIYPLVLVAHFKKKNL